MEQKYHMNFMKCDKYCFSRKKKFKKEKRNDDYDILFFNLLNIVKHSELDVFYNRKVEKGIKLNCSMSMYGLGRYYYDIKKEINTGQQMNNTSDANDMDNIYKISFMISTVVFNY